MPRKAAPVLEQLRLYNVDRSTPGERYFYRLVGAVIDAPDKGRIRVPSTVP